MAHTAPGCEINFNNHSFRFGLIFGQSYDQLEAGPRTENVMFGVQGSSKVEEPPQIPDE